MAHAAEAAGSVISAVLFGALAGTGVLPFSRAQFEATIERGGVGVKPSLKAFPTRLRAAPPRPAMRRRSRAVDASVAAPASVALDGTAEAPVVVAKELERPRAAARSAVRALLERVHDTFPAGCQHRCCSRACAA